MAHERQLLRFFLETVILVIVLALLAAVAIPEAGRMLDEQKLQSSGIDYHHESAVIVR